MIRETLRLLIDAADSDNFSIKPERCIDDKHYRIRLDSKRSALYIKQHQIDSIEIYSLLGCESKYYDDFPKLFII